MAPKTAPSTKTYGNSENGERPRSYGGEIPARSPDHAGPARAPARQANNSAVVSTPSWYVAGHRVGLRDPRISSRTITRSACPSPSHRTTGKDAMQVLDAGDWSRFRPQDRECRQERRFEREHPRQRRAAQDRGRGRSSLRSCCREQEGYDCEHLPGDAEVVGDKLSTRGRKASGHLSDEQSEQGEERVRVDIAGNEAQQRRRPAR